MKIARKFTTAGQDVYEAVKWERRSSKISGADGKTVFEMKDAEVPAGWSQLATDIVVSKYFRKAGVPQTDAAGKATTGPERSVRQVVHRLVACWKQWGQKHGYFDSRKDADAFYDELAWMLLNQVAAPNSPQWFNTGLNTAYGITGPAQGHWIADPKTGESSLADDAYTHPQPHACFIQPVRDDLVNPGGIMDLWVREARLFKYGSGTGTNFSSLRGENEPLSGGGRSSGLMSFLRIGDRAASAIKSGGTTRRAAKMVCLDVDHPDIREFVRWKVREEVKVASMVEGMRHLPKEQREIAERMGLSLDYDFNGEAYSTVSGQNSNNSVRLTDEYLQAVERGVSWNLVGRIDGKVVRTIPARELWDEICFAAWRCADPGVQFDTTINQWHTCPQSGRINASNPCSEYMFLDNTACNLASLNLLKFYDAQRRTFDVEAYAHAIRLWTIVLEISVLMAAFPSCEIAELSWKFRTLGLGYANLGALLMQAGIPYDSDEGRALCGAITAILTGRAYAASAEMAKELGPFDGYKRNREEMLRVIRNHRRAARGVSRNGAEGRTPGAGEAGATAWEGLNIAPVSIDHTLFGAGARSDKNGATPRVRIANARELLDSAVASWDDALRLGEKHGYRNAQVTVIAPTGTIGLLMDCDTTGVEPDFALTKFKKLAGGGHFKIVNQSLPPALRALGHSQEQIDDIQRYVMGTLSLDAPMPDAAGAFPGPSSDAAPRRTFRQFLESKGYSGEDLVALENELPKVFELRFAFSAWSMPDRVLAALGLDRAAANAKPGFNGLRALGLTKRQIDSLNRLVCGTQTVEGAPHLRPEHLPVFDCANTCGPLSTRFIAPEGHIRMMAAAQPFISGAISKTINLPNDATIEEIADAYTLSWRLGLKATALYRDGCKLSQPLNTSADAEIGDDDEPDAAFEAEQVSAAGATPAEATLAETSMGELSPSAAPAAPATTEAPVGSAKETSTFATSSEECRLDETGDGRLEVRDETGTAATNREPRAADELVYRPMRRRLPDTRHSLTHRFNVAGHEGYLTVGLYDDGAPGELFITMAKEGSTIGGLMDCIGTATSVSLQYGVPLKSLVNKFAHQRFEPQGITTNRDIPFAKSLVDYIFRWLGMEFIDGYREENAPAREGRDDGRRATALGAEDAPASSPAAGTFGADRMIGIPVDGQEAHAIKEDPAWPFRREHTDVNQRLDPPPTHGSPPRMASPATGATGRTASPTARFDTGVRPHAAPSPEAPKTVRTDRASPSAHDGRARIGGAAGARSFPSAPDAPAMGVRTTVIDQERTIASTGSMERVGHRSPASGASAEETRAKEILAQDARLGRTAPGFNDASTQAMGLRVHEHTHAVIVESIAAARHAAINQAHASMQADAPACSNCGHITVRAGVCYKCVNCGSQNGCS
ncbi:MAG: adenosylcobalamin-dependent ribonucleoside-diphosphate reductase [Phycisphaerales bacterium]